LKKLTEICQSLTENKIKISSVKKTSIYDIPYYITDNSKVMKFYRWKPNKNFLDIAHDTYKWLINNKYNLKKYY
jgi:CDP-paratose 2-epimerase